MQTLMTKHNPEAINNLYELRSIERTTRYLHAASCFPKKNTWLKSIWSVSYITWPLINTNNTTKFFSESEETQKGHMILQRQGIRSTKNSKLSKTASTNKTNNQHERRHDVLITAYDMKKTMHTDQTEKFPYRSSWGNRHHMIIQNIDSNSTWVEPIKYRTERELMLWKNTPNPMNETMWNSPKASSTI